MNSAPQPSHSEGDVCSSWALASAIPLSVYFNFLNFLAMCPFF